MPTTRTATFALRRTRPLSERCLDAEGPRYRDARCRPGRSAPDLPSRVLAHMATYSLADDTVDFAPAERLIAHRFHGRTKGARVVAAYDMASVMEAELEAVERGARRRPGGVAAAGAAFSAFVYMIERRFPHACFVGAADVQELLALHEASGMSGRVAVLACDAPRICVALDDPRDALIFRGWAAATLGAAA